MTKTIINDNMIMILIIDLQQREVYFQYCNNSKLIEL